MNWHNLYSGRVVYYERGSFGRCRHGHTLGIPCWRCGLLHPIKFIRHLIREIWS